MSIAPENAHEARSVLVRRDQAEAINEASALIDELPASAIRESTRNRLTGRLDAVVTAFERSAA